MDLKRWRELQGQGEEFLLPSGLKVRLRRADVLGLAEQGSIPAPLLAELGKVDLSQGISLGKIQEWTGVINVVVKASMLEPLVADEADEKHLAVSEMPLADRVAVFEWANGGVAVLRPFRPKQGQPGDAAPAGGDVPLPAVGDPGA